MPRQYKTYGLNGEPENRLELEIENVYKTKMDEQLVKYTAAPGVTTVPKDKPILVKSGGNWYIYIRIEDAFYKTAALTAV